MVESPCNNKCGLDDNNKCISCNRTLNEIINWADMTEDEKKKVIEKIEERKESEHND